MRVDKIIGSTVDGSAILLQRRPRSVMQTLADRVCITDGGQGKPRSVPSAAAESGMEAVMVARDGFVQHYTPLTVNLSGLVLDPAT